MKKQERLERLFRAVMGENVHTAFRKGSSHHDAQKVWLAISKMDQGAWESCVEWMCWALAYSLNSKLEVKDKSGR